MPPPRTLKPATFKPMVPDVPPVSRVIARRQTALAGLMQRLQRSQACLAVVREVLPPAMANGLQAGGWDEEGWTLLVPNSAVSAKLRQWQPRLMDVLAARGLKVNAIRVKIAKGAR
ncbi:MAG: hypothetical protein RI907_3541 [Pseudomonadota bacterium]